MSISVILEIFHKCVLRNIDYVLSYTTLMFLNTDCTIKVQKPYPIPILIGDCDTPILDYLFKRLTTVY